MIIMVQSFQDAMKGKSKVDTQTLPSFIKWSEEGDWVAGKVTGIRKVDGEFGESDVFDICYSAGATAENRDLKPGEMVSVGSLTELKCLADMVGKEVVIKFTGQESKKNASGQRRVYKHFEVYSA